MKHRERNDDTLTPCPLATAEGRRSVLVRVSHVVHSGKRTPNRTSAQSARRAKRLHPCSFLPSREPDKRDPARSTGNPMDTVDSGTWRRRVNRQTHTICDIARDSSGRQKSKSSRIKSKRLVPVEAVDDAQSLPDYAGVSYSRLIEKFGCSAIDLITIAVRATLAQGVRCRTLSAAREIYDIGLLVNSNGLQGKRGPPPSSFKKSADLGRQRRQSAGACLSTGPSSR